MKHSLWVGGETINHFMRSTHGWWQNLNATQRFIHTQEMPKHTFFISPLSEMDTWQREVCPENPGGHILEDPECLWRNMEHCQLLPISRQRQMSFTGFDFLRGKNDGGQARKWDEAQLEIWVVAPSPLTSFKLNYYPCFVDGWNKNWKTR